MKRLIFLALCGGFGAVLGAYTFIWKVNHLPRNQSLHISQANPPIFVGAAGGVLIGETIATLSQRAKRKRQQEQLKQAIFTEAELQGLDLEQQAVLLAAVERMQKTVTGN
ncbi:MAG TPA: hypothetical protein V6D10_05855 [Trichocoleus sp.]|jgi:hypothetical protein